MYFKTWLLSAFGFPSSFHIISVVQYKVDWQEICSSCEGRYGSAGAFHRDPFFAAWSRQSLVFQDETGLPPPLLLPEVRIGLEKSPPPLPPYTHSVRRHRRIIFQAFNRVIPRNVSDDVYTLYDSAYSQPALPLCTNSSSLVFD